jgi:oligoendopeptidase F
MQEQITLPSNNQIEDAIVRAYDAIKNASNKAASSDITQTAANTLTKYSNELQTFLNTFLQKKGAVTQNQLDELDEKIRQAKRKTLESESKNTFVKYGLYISVAFVAFGALWLITREKK